jgi:hypothetical protein
MKIIFDNFLLIFAYLPVKLFFLLLKLCFVFFEFLQVSCFFISTFVRFTDPGECIFGAFSDEIYAFKNVSYIINAPLFGDFKSKGRL